MQTCTQLKPLKARRIRYVMQAVALMVWVGLLLLPVTSSAQTGGQAETSPPDPTPSPSERASQRQLSGLQVQPSHTLIRVEQNQIADSLSAFANQIKPTPQPSSSTRQSQLILPQIDYPPLDYSTLEKLSWSEVYAENFDLVSTSNPLLSTFTTPFTGGTQPITSERWGPIDITGQGKNYAAWPFSGNREVLSNGYPANRYSQLTYGPLDFSKQERVLLGFGLWHDFELEPGDFLALCATVNKEDYDCFDVYFGQSVSKSEALKGWTDKLYSLTNYAGYKTVWLNWIFISNTKKSASKIGPFIDQIAVWGVSIDAEPPEPPELDSKGVLLKGGSFEGNGDLKNWQQISDVPLSAAEVVVVDDKAFDGNASVRMTGTKADFLFQTVTIPEGAWNMDAAFWYSLESKETQPETDWLCGSIRQFDEDTLGKIIVDLGCVDAFHADDMEDVWGEALLSLLPEDVRALRGKKVDFTLELYNNGDADSGTTVYIDDVQIYALGGDAAAYIDKNEFNDLPKNATEISCGQTMGGLIGNAFGGYDVDWFVVKGVPVGRLDVDIDAASLPIASPLDSTAIMYDKLPDLYNLPSPVASNDDDALSDDSYLSYDVTTAGKAYYIAITEFDTFADPYSTYRITVNCAGQGSGPPKPPTENPLNQAKPKAWTIMLYLNAEDIKFEKTLTQYRADLEALIGDKKEFVNIVILYDGPADSKQGNSGTTRYLVQPDGNYTDGTNRWPMREANMGSPDTLARFISWAMERYPAEKYYLAIDDHGDGAYGISKDETSNDTLTPPELYAALKQATRNGERTIDIMDYEACLMGLAENAYDMQGFVDYMIFFEQISWGIDTYPQYFKDLQANDEAKDVAIRILDRYDETVRADNGGLGQPFTMSLIDTDKVGAVSTALNSFATALSQTTTVTDVTNIRRQSQAFANSSQATNPGHADYIDLKDFAENARSLVPTQAQAVMDAVDNAVVAQRVASGQVSGIPWNHSGANGLAVYFPASQFSDAFVPYFNRRMSRSGQWDEFLNAKIPVVSSGGTVPTTDGRGQSSRGQSSRGQSSRGQSSRAQEKLGIDDTVDPTTFITNGSKNYLPLIVK